MKATTSFRGTRDERAAAPVAPPVAQRARGAALVEAALVLPVLLAIVCGIIEYGWCFLKAQQITNAARQGARVGATPDAADADVTSAIANLMSQADLDASGYTVSIAPAVDTVATGGTLTVRVTVPYSNIELLGVPFVPTPANLVGETSMAKEGP